MPPEYLKGKKSELFKTRNIYSKINNFLPKTKLHFSGNSPPEIFVGKYNYPNINAGILSPEQIGNTEDSSMPEIWHEKNLSINQILSKRAQLIYGKFKTQIKQTKKGQFTKLMQEISMAYKPVSTEFFLKKAPSKNLEINNHNPIIANPAPLQYARLEENPKIKKKVDYLVSDTDSKAANSIQELHKSKIKISNIIKVLSAGLLGLSSNRKLVPTRWSITATDDTISKNLLKKIRYYQEINEIKLFHSEYLGNHYEILLLPDKFSFEVIEGEIKGSLFAPNKTSLWQDYELFHGRKKYADSVTGAYYANRLALTEYLEKIKRQCTAIFLREARPEYNAPLGVGILREVTRSAFKKNPEKFPTVQEALNQAQSRMKLPISIYKENSMLLKEFGKQTKLSKWF
jgi:DNA repair protein NreA